MSIPVLIQAYDEVRRLAIAGSVVAPGDFRLKKLVPLLEQVGQKAPVFAKVAEAVKQLAESREQTSAAALLELATLVNSILYTQGETGMQGELTPLPTVALGRPRTQASARVLKPLQEALTTTGSGRLEIIRDGYERGAFHDLRLIAPALAALDDSYAEIADLAAQKILPLFGPAIVPELQANFDPRGRGGHVRRLLLMHRLDPEAARPLRPALSRRGLPGGACRGYRLPGRFAGRPAVSAATGEVQGKGRARRGTEGPGPLRRGRGRPGALRRDPPRRLVPGR